MNVPPALTTFLLVVAWPAITGVVNTVAHYATPKDVDAWAEKNPGIAWLASLMRRGGFEPVALIGTAFAWFATLPPPPAFIGGNSAMGKRRGFVPLRVLAVLSILAVGCGLLGPAAVPAIASLAVCVETEVRDHSALGSPLAFFDLVAKVAIDCGGDAESVLATILASKDPATLASAEYRDARMVDSDPSLKERLRVHVAAKLAAHRASR